MEASLSLKGVALGYGRIGLRVVPNHDVSSGVCSCRDPACNRNAGKHPRITRFPSKSSADPKTIEKWWQRWPRANVGHYLTKDGELTALDIEHPNEAHPDRPNGVKAFEELCERMGINLSRHPTYRTPSGGLRMFGRLPDELRNIGSLPAPCEGVEILGRGGKSKNNILPPSKTPYGDYAWKDDWGPEDLEDLPEFPAQLWNEAVAAQTKGNGSSDEKRRSSRVYASFVKAAAAYNADHAAEFPASNSPCPMCGSPDGFKRLGDDPMRWVCHSSRHQRGMGGTACASCFIGSVLDIKAASRGVRPWNLLVSEGYLNGGAEPDGGLPWNDVGNAQRLQRERGDVLRYAHGIGFHVWDGRRWELDNGDARVRRMAQHLREIIREETANIEDEKLAKKAAAFASQSGNAARIRGALEQLRVLHGVWSEPGMLDDPTRTGHLLNCMNGVVDLRTGTLQPHDPGLLITKLCPVAYDPTAKAPRFEEFLREVLESDKVVEFLLVALGYAFTADTRGHFVLLLTGVGRNGKSLLLDVVRDILGAYGTSIPLAALTQSAFGGDRPQPALVTLRGCRMATATEASEEMRLDEGVLKMLSGGDSVLAHAKFKDPIEFKNTAKIFIATNVEPRMSGVDSAIYDRLRIIRFPRRFVADPGPGEYLQDPRLGELLREEWAGILALLVQGAMRWYRELRLPDCREVLESVAKYRESQKTPVHQFLDAEYMVAAGSETLKADLYRHYKSWHRDHMGGEQEPSEHAFATTLGHVLKRDARYASVTETRPRRTGRKPVLVGLRLASVVEQAAMDEDEESGSKGPPL